MSDVLYAWRFKGGTAIMLVREVDGELHLFQRLPGLPDFDLTETDRPPRVGGPPLPTRRPLSAGPPTWNPLVELVPEEEL